MKPTDWILFALTFLTGLFIGASLYILSFKPVYAPDDLGGAEDKAMEFSVIGKTYGGMVGPEYIRPSFRLLADGSYSYIPGGTDESALTPIEGKLSRSLMNNVKAVVREDELRTYATPVDKDTCQLYVDGYDYQYQVILEGTVYQIDTCRTNVSYDSDFYAVFAAIWSEMSGEPMEGSLNISGSGSVSGDSLQEQAQSWLKSRLDPTPED